MPVFFMLALFYADTLLNDDFTGELFVFRKFSAVFPGADGFGFRSVLLSLFSYFVS